MCNAGYRGAVTRNVGQKRWLEMLQIRPRVHGMTHAHLNENPNKVSYLGLKTLLVFEIFLAGLTRSPARVLVSHCSHTGPKFPDRTG